MKIFKKLSGTAILFAVLLLTACDKENDLGNLGSAPDPIPEQTTNPCNLDSVFYDDGSGPVRTSVYIYDPNNKIIRINEFNFNNQLSSFLTYTYNSQGKAAEEIYHFANQTIMGRQIFTYNASNQLTRIDFKGLSAWNNGYYPVVPHYVVMHYNAAGKRTRTDLYDSANVLQVHFDFTYNQNKIFAAEYDATTTPDSLIRVREYHFDTKISAHHALGYLNGMVPDMEKHNLINMKIPGADWSSGYLDITYQYDSLGYPVRNVANTGIGWGPSTTIYKYNCQ